MGSNEKPLKNIVSGIIRKLEKKEKEGALLAAWQKAVGKAAGAHTKPVSFKTGRLVVNVSDSSRLYNLTLKRKEIVEDLNRILKKKKIKEVRFRIGQI